MIPPFIENLFMATMDSCYRLIPQATPSLAQLKNCKLVSHRGERDNITVFENTLESLGKAVENSIAGIEFDIRWTQDLVPIVFHDTNCQRIFNDDLVIGEVSFQKLREKFPLIPSFREVIEAFGKKSHLFIEIKKENFPELEKQQSILKDHLQVLEEGTDFHVITLDPETLPIVNFLDSKTKGVVSDINFSKMASYAREHNLGGLLGHYLFLNNKFTKQFHENKQFIATGYVNSKNLLFREVNRGVDWIFSNDAIMINQIRKQAIELIESKQQY